MNVTPPPTPHPRQANIRLLEGKLGEARSKKDTLKARAASAKTSLALQEMIGGLQVRSGEWIACVCVCVCVCVCCVKGRNPPMCVCVCVVCVATCMVGLFGGPVVWWSGGWRLE